MSTDNAENALSHTLVGLSEAAGLCKKNDVTVFGIFPPRSEFDSLGEGYDYDILSSMMRRAADDTGGAFYIAGSDFDTGDIISQIQRHEAMQVDEITMTRVVDEPAWPLMMLFSGILLLAAAKGGGL
jgi:hypothetical protein